MARRHYTQACGLCGVHPPSPPDDLTHQVRHHRHLCRPCAASLGVPFRSVRDVERYWQDQLDRSAARRAAATSALPVVRLDAIDEWAARTYAGAPLRRTRAAVRPHRVRGPRRPPFKDTLNSWDDLINAYEISLGAIDPME